MLYLIFKMLIFIQNYLFLKKIYKLNFYVYKKNINLNENNYIIKKINDYPDLNKFIKIFLNLIINKINLCFLLSKFFKNEQYQINSYLNLNKKFEIIFILDKNLNKKKIDIIKNYNLPIFFINNQNINKRYFDYNLSVKNNFLYSELFLIEMYLYLYSKINKKNFFLVKKKYTIYYLNNLLKNV